MRFDIITIFPSIFDSYLKESLISRAQKKKLIKINIHNLRKWAKDKRKTVDDRPFGGGLGMVLKIQPIYKAVGNLKAKSYKLKTKTVLFTPRGRKFNQKIAYQLSKMDQIIFICGRYEGVDERVAKHIADMELSIGDYDLMGGELPAMVAIEVISRLVPGVLGKKQLLKERITKDGGFIEYQQYTRPEVFKIKNQKSKIKVTNKRSKINYWRALPPKSSSRKFWRVPKVLLSGDHKKIQEWKKSHRKVIE